MLTNQTSLRRLRRSHSFYQTCAELRRELECPSDQLNFLLNELFCHFETDQIFLALCPMSLLTDIYDNLPSGPLRSEIGQMITDALWP